MLVTHREFDGRWVKINVDPEKAAIVLANPNVCKCCKRGIIDFTKAHKLSNEHWVHNECIEFMLLPYVQELDPESHPIFRCPSCSTRMEMTLLKTDDRKFDHYHGYCPNEGCTNQNMSFVVRTEQEIQI